MARRRRRHYPPSRIRYEKEHPLVAVRVNKELKEFLDKLRVGEGGEIKSYAEVIKEIITKSYDAYKKWYEDVYMKGHKEGFEDALNMVFDLEPKDAAKYNIVYPLCPNCGKPMRSVIVRKGSKLGEWVLEQIRENGWHHTKC